MKKFAPEVMNCARRKYRSGYSAAETLRQMELDEDLAKFDLPTKRTVEHWFARFRQEETVEPWTLEDTPSEDAQIVLAHWKRSAEWAVQNGFAMPIISKVLAQRLIWVHKAAPGIPLSLAWIVANDYFDSPNKAYWNLLLATKAWQSEEANQEFYRLAKAFFGAPIHDLSRGGRDDYKSRYPLGLTPFHLLGQSAVPSATEHFS